MSLKKLVDLDLLGRAVTKIKALIPNASSAAPGKVASSSSQGSSANYARQDHTHGIDLATGDSNGQVKIAGSNVSVKGLAALAYKASLGKSDVGLGNVDNVKQYSASNPPPYPVTSVNGSTGAVTVSVPSAATTAPKMDGTAAVGSSAKYAKEDHVHPSDTTKYTIKSYDNGTTDISVRPLVAYTRANRFAFLPADQIIIEQTTNGGTTWVDAGYSDAQKKALFANRGASIQIPLLNSAKSDQCGVRITFSAMKYNVPDGTAETSKYNYWSSTYVKSQERYSNLREMWFWLNANADTIRVQVYCATGNNPNTWSTAFDTNFGLTGWSGSDWIRLGGQTFGGGTNQPQNYWNWRVVFWSRIPDGKTAFQSASAQQIYGIAGYGDCVWGTPNALMKEDHLYNWDVDQNASFPANVTATKFIGNLQGNADSATNSSKVNNHTVNADVPSNAKFTDTTALGSMTGTLGVDHGGTGKTTANDAANVFMNALGIGSSTPVDADYYISQYVGGGTTTTTYHRRPMSALWEYIKGKISSVLGLTASSYGGSAAKVNNHTVAVDVPSGAKFTDTTYSAGDGLILSGTKFSDHRGIEYIRGTWTSASGTWTGVSTDTELYDGKQIILYMPYGGSGNATLNLTLAGGGTTGAKNVYFESTTRFTTHKGQNSQLHLIYHSALTLSNGNTYEGWWYVANRDTTDVYKLGRAYNSIKAKAAIYRYQILLTYDGEYLLPVSNGNNNVETNKTMTTEKFDPLAQIYYWSSTTTVSANAKLNDWNLCAAHYNNGLIDLRYAFNTGTTLTANKAIYLVCVPQSDGSAKLHATPISQTLPSSEDGRIYKYLGQAYDTYRISLDEHKPCYYYKNGCIRLWTNQDAGGGSAKIFTNVNVPASAWADTGDEDLPFRATIALSGVTSSHMPIVTFLPDDLNNYIISPVAQSYNGGIYIYADELVDAAITIPTISCLEGA